jgi:GNAT superfamily N-acetyltransferase
MIELAVARTDEELESWRQVRLAVQPGERTAPVEEIRRRLREEPYRLYLLAYRDGELVASGFAGKSDLGHASLMPLVPEQNRGQGLGSALLERLVEHAREQGFTAVGGLVDGADEHSVGWALRRGFEEIDRQVEMVRTLEGPLPEPPPLEGVEFVTIEERPELLEQAYDLAREGYADLKLAVGEVSVGLEEWLRDEATLAGGSFVALDNGEIVGYAGLMAWPGDASRSEHGLTVVRRAWRRRGLATALKSRELAWASRNGLRELVTWTQTGNEALQGVNERLGYETRSVVLSVRKDLE